jgi:transcriptional regulator with XRE-family HTH domain
MNLKKTLREESEIFGVSLNTVYRWEHNLATPRKSALIKIAAFYEVPLSWLLHGNVDAEDDTNCDGCILDSENDIEQKMLNIFRKLSENRKYKVLGYIERIYMGDLSETEK